MASKDFDQVMQCGRTISSHEIAQIQETVGLFPRLSLMELTATICEHLSWYTAAGNLKKDACTKLLSKLQAAGLLKLPQKKQPHKKSQKASVSMNFTPQTDPQSELSIPLKDLGVIKLQLVKTKPSLKLCNEYLQRYHPLGYKKPFGYPLRYFITSEHRSILGCLLFAGAAKALTLRDRWIGWNESQRLRNLPWVINNTRFLILPWVHVKNLSSHLLALLTRRIGEDWENRWNYRPLLIETFVNPLNHEGSCYKAAGWLYLGMTRGTGLVREGKTYSTTPKKIFVKPLKKNFRELLCSETAGSWEPKA